MIGRLVCWSFLCLLVSFPGCFSDSNVLPSGDELGSFADLGDPEFYGSATLYTYMNGGAEIFLEYGFVALSVRRYSRGTDQLIVELFEMKDPAASAALYSYMRRLGAELEVATGCRASVTPSEVLLAKGIYYLACRNEDPMATQGSAVRELSGRIADRLAGDCASGVFGLIRAPNQIPGSEIAIMGPIGLGVRPWLAPLGKEGLERGWLASYQTTSCPVEALLADYQTPALARASIGRISPASHPAIRAETQGRRIVIVNSSSAASSEDMAALVDSLLVR